MKIEGGNVSLEQQKYIKDINKNMNFGGVKVGEAITNINLMEIAENTDKIVKILGEEKKVEAVVKGDNESLIELKKSIDLSNKLILAEKTIKDLEVLAPLMGVELKGVKTKKDIIDAIVNN